MGTTTKITRRLRAIKEGATNAPAPIRGYDYVRNDDNFVLHESEFALVREFLEFIRERERGIFTARIVTSSNERAVIIDKTDHSKIVLNRL